MNNPMEIPSTHQMRSTLAYTVLPPMSESSISFGPTCKPSSSWRKFVNKTALPSGSEFVITTVSVPAERTTTEGPVVLKPAPLPEDYDARIESFLRFLDSLGSEPEKTDNLTTE